MALWLRITGLETFSKLVREVAVGHRSPSCDPQLDLLKKPCSPPRTGIEFRSPGSQLLTALTCSLWCQVGAM